MRPLRLLRYCWLRVLRQKDDPERIAGGLALGVFVGFLLPPGIQLVVVLALAPLFRCNLVTAALGTLVTNPFTIPFLYPLALKLGECITGLSIRNESVPVGDQRFWAYVTDLRTHGRVVLLLAMGLITMGAAMALPSYYLAKWAVIRHRYRKRMRKKRAAAAKAASGGGNTPG